MNTLTKEQSKTLTLLKGFAIILVIMIHCDVRDNMGVAHLSGLDMYMQGLTRIVVINAVPMFFFISGFLGATDKPCGEGVQTLYPKTVAKRYMIPKHILPLPYES